MDLRSDDEGESYFGFVDAECSGGERNGEVSGLVGIAVVCVEDFFDHAWRRVFLCEPGPKGPGFGADFPEKRKPPACEQVGVLKDRLRWAV